MAGLFYAMDSSKYWNNRWGDAPDKYEASWRSDPHMRILELDVIYHRLRSLVSTPKVLEIGCGAFTLDEYPALLEALERGQYVGIDTSASAIARARQAYPNSAALSFSTGSAIHAANHEAIRDLRDEGFTPNFLLCRRVLQNMSKEDRAVVIGCLSRYPHGMLLECTQDGLERCNLIRSHHNLDPIKAPQYNEYLTYRECVQIESEVRAVRTFPFSHYYRRTRAEVDRRTPGGDVLAFWEQVCGGRYDTPHMGPLTVWSW